MITLTLLTDRCPPTHDTVCFADHVGFREAREQARRGGFRFFVQCSSVPYPATLVDQGFCDGYRVWQFKDDGGYRATDWIWDRGAGRLRIVRVPWERFVQR